MPMYSWRCTKEGCKKLIDIIRTFDGHRDPPSEEEGGQCPEGEHTWEKKIHVPLMTKGAAWGAGKGNWAVLLAFIATSLLAGCANDQTGYATSLIKETETPHAWCVLVVFASAPAISCVPKGTK